MTKYILFFMASFILIAWCNGLRTTLRKAEFSNYLSDGSSSNVSGSQAGTLHWGTLTGKKKLDSALSKSDIFAIKFSIAKWEDATSLNSIEIQTGKSQKTGSLLQSQISDDGENGIYAVFNRQSLGYTPKALPSRLGQSAEQIALPFSSLRPTSALIRFTLLHTLANENLNDKEIAPALSKAVECL